MLPSPTLRQLITAAFLLTFFFTLSAQNHRARATKLFHRAHATVDCTNDQIAPQVHCPAGPCLPNARAAYLISTYGEPWGVSNNIDAMNAVFGSNWDAMYMENANASLLLSPAYKVIFLEGSYYGGYTLDAFLSAHLPALENWVAAGGALFINSSASNSPNYIQLGFDGAMLQNYYSNYNGYVQAPGNSIFNGPFTPANGDFYGSFGYAIILDPASTALITGDNGTVILAEKTWGDGKVVFGGMNSPYYHSPQPNGQYLRQNILAALNTHCNNKVLLTADAGACTATAAAQVLDATASDECALVSLTHDFATAPANTSLDGAIFSTTPTLIRWTATDAAGNTASCEFYVAAQEPEIPGITCPGPMAVTALPGECSAEVSFLITATDNCTATPTIVSTPASGSTLPSGLTTVQATATDESGNTATCSFEVTISGNPELCNGLDDDCNGLIDDGAPADNTFYADADGDGYGDPGLSILACQPPSGYVANALDCNDANYYIQPGMYESCNELDDNCDGNIDEGVTNTWYADADGDGYGDPLVLLLACNQPQGYTYSPGDCDDDNAYIHPGAQEDCTNEEDENCDGILGDNDFTITETHTDVYCGSTPDGTIALTILPAQIYTVILWSNNICCTTTQTNLPSGTYKVTVSNECGTTKTKTIKILPSATPALEVVMSGTAVKCYGDANGTVTATPKKGCAGYTYKWDNGSTDATLTGLSGGTYSVVVTDGCGCTQTGTFTVVEPYAPLSIYTGTIIALLDGNYWVQVLPYGGTAPYTFRRNTIPSGFTPWTSSNGFADVAPGNYVFEVKDKNGCVAQVSITLPPFSPRPLHQPEPTEATLPEIDFQAPESNDLQAREQTVMEAEPEALLFPNPTEGELNIEWSGMEGRSAAIQILNNMGQVVRTLSVPDDALRVMTNVGDLPAGLYFVKIQATGRQLKVLRLIRS